MNTRNFHKRSPYGDTEFLMSSTGYPGRLLGSVSYCSTNLREVFNFSVWQTEPVKGKCIPTLVERGIPDEYTINTVL